MGGLVEVGGHAVHNYNLISYDITTKRVSLDEFPPLSQHKLRPLVIQLLKKLYVFDTSDYVVDDSFEVYAPEENLWTKVRSPYFFPDSAYFWKGYYSGVRTPYSWFAFGKSICLSGPLKSNSFIHHTDQYIRCFVPRFRGLLPFHGMATTYYQRGFTNVVVISFSHGRVEGRQLNGPPYSLGDPILI